MRRRWVVWGLVALAVVVVGGAVATAVAVPYLVETARVQALIATTASQALGRPVTFRRVSVRVLPRPAVALHDLQIAEDPAFGREPFLRLERGLLHLRLGALLRGRVDFGELVLRQPRIAVIQDLRGRWNVASLGAVAVEPRGAARPPGGGAPAGVGAAATVQVTIEDGIVTYLARAPARGTAVEYRVEDLDAHVTPRPGQTAFEGTGRLVPGDLAVRIRDGLVTLTPARPLLEAPVRGTVEVEARDVSPLAAMLAPRAPTLGGPLRGTLRLGGTVGAPTASGDVAMARPTVTHASPQCQAPARRVLELGPAAANAVLEDRRVLLRPLTTGIGKGTITTSVTAVVDRGVRVELADLALRAVPLERVLVDFLCQGYAVTGPLDLTGSLAFAAADVAGTLAGPGTLRVGAGRVVGSDALALVARVVQLGGAVSALLSADLPASLGSSPLEFDSITATYRITSGVVTTRDLLYTSRALRVSAAGTYALPTGRVDFDMVLDHGRGRLQAKVTGTAANPSVRVSPAGVLRDLDPRTLERGLDDLLRRFR
jgi:uncharacterized protein involved in outer membrane biogenesis